MQGVVRLSRSLASDPLGRVLAQIDGSPFPRRMSRAGEVSELAELRSDALSCKRAFLLEHGLFDPKLGSGCEEVELAWRLAPQGFTVVREPSAAATVERIPAFDDLCAAFTEEGASRFVLGRTHPQEPVQRFSQVEQARRLWPKLAPVADALVRSARELDRIVGLRRAAGLAVTSLDATLLERGYWTALRISRLSGMARKAAEMGFELGGAVSPTPLSATSTQM